MKLRLVILSLLAIGIACEIRLVEPANAINKFSKKGIKGEIDYEISTFGRVDYQANSLVEIHEWPTVNGCEDWEKVPKGNPKQQRGFLIQRGGCSYYAQSENGQKVGATLMLVYRDDDDEIHSDLPISKNKERLNNPPPIIVISRADGLKIKELLKTGPVKIYFDMDIATLEPPVNLKFVFRSIDPVAIETYFKIVDFNIGAEEHRRKVKKSGEGFSSDLMIFQPISKVYGAGDLNYSEKDKKKLCVGQGNYCVLNTSPNIVNPLQELQMAVLIRCMGMHVFDGPKNNGGNHLFLSQILKEYHQILLTMPHRDAPIDIMADVLAMLSGKKDLADKDLSPLNLLVIKKVREKYFTSVLSCYMNNGGSELAKSKTDNVMLGQLKEGSYMDFDKVPSVFIENNLVRGDLSWDNALSAFCDVLSAKDKVPECDLIEVQLSQKFMEAEALEEETMSFPKLFFLVGISVLILYVVYKVAKWLLASRLEADMKSEIDGTLDRYYKAENLNNSTQISFSDTELKANNS